MKKLFYNQILDKKGTKKILSWFLENYGSTRTSQLIEELKVIGFHFATLAGLSLGFDDLKIPKKKIKILETAESHVFESEKKFFQGKITAVERYQKFIDIWTTASETLKDEVIQNFQNTDLFNPLYMMAFSGARGNISQVRQLVGMRGLMSDSAGGIIDFPIRSNFREGLTVTEYVISCYGARKGLIDTALRTADSGYLTRRLVDVAHGIIIGRYECHTQENFDILPLKSSSDSILLSLEKRIVGRILGENISNQLASVLCPKGSESPGSTLTRSSCREAAGHFEVGPFGGHFEVAPEGAHSLGTHSLGTSREKARLRERQFLEGEIGFKNQEISPLLAQKITRLLSETSPLSKKSISIRSPLTCRHFQDSREDICQLCYGWSLAHNRMVSLGEAVGIIAAQSIGEPGTQLTMRTFHTGGIFSTDIDAKLFAPHSGNIFFSKNLLGKKVRSFHGQSAFFTFEAIQLKIVSSKMNAAPWLAEDSQAAAIRAEVTSSGAEIYATQPAASRHRQNGRIESGTIISIFSLPPHSLLFVYPGQTVSKDFLCAEIAQLINARPTLPLRKGSQADQKDNSSSYSVTDLHSPVKTGSVLESNAYQFLRVEKPSHSVAADTSEDALGAPLEEDQQVSPAKTKKVLSEIEGQIYFQQQKKDFSNQRALSPKALWVLHGKGTFSYGPFRSGDFISKNKRILSSPRHEGANTAPTGRADRGASPWPPRGWQEVFKAKPGLICKFYSVSLENLALENLALENLALENLALENLALEKIYYFQVDSSKYHFSLYTGIQNISSTSAGKRARVSLPSAQLSTLFPKRLPRQPPKGLQNYSVANEPVEAWPSSSRNGEAESRGYLFKTTAKQSGVKIGASEPISYKNLLPIFLQYTSERAFPSSLGRLSFLGKKIRPKPGEPDGFIAPSGHAGIAEILSVNRLRKTFLLKKIFNSKRVFQSCAQRATQNMEVTSLPNFLKKWSLPHSLAPLPTTHLYGLVAKSFFDSVPEKSLGVDSPLRVGNSSLYTAAVRTSDKFASKAEMVGSMTPSALGRLSYQPGNSRAGIRAEHGELRFSQKLEFSSALNDWPTSSGDLNTEMGTTGQLPGWSVLPVLISPQEEKAAALIVQPGLQSGQVGLVSGLESKEYFKKSLNIRTSDLRIYNDLEPSPLPGPILGRPVQPASSPPLPVTKRWSKKGGDRDQSNELFGKRLRPFGGYFEEAASRPPQSSGVESSPQSAQVRQRGRLGSFESKIGDFILIGETGRRGLEQVGLEAIQGLKIQGLKTAQIFHRKIVSDPLYPSRLPERVVDPRSGPMSEGVLPSWEAGELEKTQVGLVSGKVLVFRRVHPYLLSKDSPLMVNHGDIVESRELLFELFYQQSKTGDIVQGLPKIEQLFEARRTSLHVVETIHLRLKEKFDELCCSNSLYEAVRLSIRFIQRILIDEIQLVYQSQGVDIADKHIEIIVRQMTSKVIIQEKGRSPFFPDDIINFSEIEKFITSTALASSPLWSKKAVQGRELAVQNEVAGPQRGDEVQHEVQQEAAAIVSSIGLRFEPLVLGLTKVAFLTESFISAASFQESKRVLMGSALQSRVDFLYGLKENVIVGRFIRAGTGFRSSLFPETA